MSNDEHTPQEEVLHGYEVWFCIEIKKMRQKLVKMSPSLQLKTGFYKNLKNSVFR